MADPLTQATNALAPPPASSNYFDPAPGRDVIARYGQSRALGESLQGALRLSGLARSERLGQIREPVAAMQAQEYVAGAPLRARQQEVARTELDLRDQDLMEQKAFRDTRDDVIEAFAQVDATDPEYPALRDEFVKGLTGAALDDPVLSDILSVKDRRAEQAQRLRDDLAKTQAQEEKEIAVLNARTEQKYGFAGVTPELREQYRMEDGTTDMFGLSYAAGEAAARRAMDQFQGKSDITKERQKEVMGVRQQMQAAEQAVEENPVAFPDQLDILRRSHIAAKLKLPTTEEMTAKQFRDEVQRVYPTGIEGLDAEIQLERPIEFAEAMQWSKNRKDMERGAARRMTKRDFVDAVPGLSEKDKQERARFWEVFNTDAEAADQAVPADRVDMPGFESEAEQAAAAATPTQEDIQRARQIAGGDREKFIQALKDMGY